MTNAIFEATFRLYFPIYIDGLVGSDDTRKMERGRP